MARVQAAVTAATAAAVLAACGGGVPERATFSTSTATVESRYHSHCDDDGCGDGDPTRAPSIRLAPGHDLTVTTSREAELVSATLSTTPTEIRNIAVESEGDERRWRIRVPPRTPPGATVSAFVEYGGGDQASYAVRLAPPRKTRHKPKGSSEIPKTSSSAARPRRRTAGARGKPLLDPSPTEPKVSV